MSFAASQSWCNRHESDLRIFSKIDRAIVNTEWELWFGDSEVQYMVDNLSNHSPLKIKFHEEFSHKIQPFRFCEMWMANESFHDMLVDSLKVQTRGTTMYKLVGYLKPMKKPLKRVNK